MATLLDTFLPGISTPESSSSIDKISPPPRPTTSPNISVPVEDVKKFLADEGVVGIKQKRIDFANQFFQEPSFPSYTLTGTVKDKTIDPKSELFRKVLEGVRYYNENFKPFGFSLPIRDFMKSIKASPIGHVMNVSKELTRVNKVNSSAIAKFNKEAKISPKSGSDKEVQKLVGSLSKKDISSMRRKQSEIDKKIKAYNKKIDDEKSVSGKSKAMARTAKKKASAKKSVSGKTKARTPKTEKKSPKLGHYQCFVRGQMKEMKNSDKTPQEKMKKVGDKWRKLSDKQKSHYGACKKK